MGLRQRPDEASEDALCGVTLASLNAEARVDAPGSGSEALASLVLGLLADEVGEGAEPDVPLDDALGRPGLVDEVAQALADLERSELAPASHERLEQSVAGGEALV